MGNRGTTWIGVDPPPDSSAWMDKVEEAANARGLKLSANRKQLLARSLATRSDCANPVVNWLSKAGKAGPDPLRGLHETADSGKSAVVAHEVVPDLRKTDHLRRAQVRRIETLLDREVRLHGPDGCYQTRRIKVDHKTTVADYCYNSQPEYPRKEIRDDILGLETETGEPLAEVRRMGTTKGQGR